MGEVVAFALCFVKERSCPGHLHLASEASRLLSHGAALSPWCCEPQPLTPAEGVRWAFSTDRHPAPVASCNSSGELFPEAGWEVEAKFGAAALAALPVLPAEERGRVRMDVGAAPGSGLCFAFLGQ